MPVTDVIIDEIVATVRTVDNTSLLDPKLVRRLVHAVLAGTDERQIREQRRRDNSRIDEPSGREPPEGW